MSALVFEHVLVSELPAEWRAKLHAEPAARVTVRIEEETTAVQDLTGNPLFGLWRDRDDMHDVAEYVRKVRGPRYFPDSSRSES